MFERRCEIVKSKSTRAMINRDYFVQTLLSLSIRVTRTDLWRYRATDSLTQDSLSD